MKGVVFRERLFEPILFLCRKRALASIGFVLEDRRREGTLIDRLCEGGIRCTEISKLGSLLRPLGHIIVPRQRQRMAYCSQSSLFLKHHIFESKDRPVVLAKQLPIGQETAKAHS